MNDEQEILKLMLAAIDSIEAYIAPGRIAFRAESMRQDAVTWRVGTLGEAAKRLPRAWRSQYSHVPWGAIAGTRDVLFHDFEHVDIEGVWQIAHDDLPLLKVQLQRILNEQDNSLLR